MTLAPGRPGGRLDSRDSGSESDSGNVTQAQARDWTTAATRRENRAVDRRSCDSSMSDSETRAVTVIRRRKAGTVTDDRTRTSNLQRLLFKFLCSTVAAAQAGAQ